MVKHPQGSIFSTMVGVGDEQSICLVNNQEYETMRNQTCLIRWDGMGRDKVEKHHLGLQDLNTTVSYMTQTRDITSVCQKALMGMLTYLWFILNMK